MLEEDPVNEEALLPCIDIPVAACVMDDVFVLPDKTDGRDAPESVPMG